MKQTSHTYRAYVGPFIDGLCCINSQTMSRICTTDGALVGQIGESVLWIYKIGTPYRVEIFDEVVVLL